MEIVFRKSGIERAYQALIYRARDGYRIVIGREGTEQPPTKNFMGYYAISDFMDRPEVEEWIREQVKQLEKSDKKAVFSSDENIGYLTDVAFEQLASGSVYRTKVI